MLFQGKLELSSIKKNTIQFYKIWFIEIDNIGSPISELFLTKLWGITQFSWQLFSNKRIRNHVPVSIVFLMKKSFNEIASYDVMILLVALALIYADASLSGFQIWKWQYVL